MADETNVQNEGTQNAETLTAPETKVVKVSISGLIQDLQNGIDRDGIAEKYGLTKAAVGRIFQHPKLKGLRVQRPSGAKGMVIEIEDDAPERVVKPTKAKKETASDNAELHDDTAVTSDATNQVVDQPATQVENPGEAKKGVWD